MMGIEHVIRQITKAKHLREKEKHDNRLIMTRAKEDLKMPTGFECFMCGTKFMTNEERKNHLKESKHDHLYNTISPQEWEEVKFFEDK
ncbi:MAG: hypothetical protein ACRD8Z_06545 [Nitrososphaeraceae archaeon]